jgi:murein DD-endopeptidase MepM/ murein hydrolase activator NlpD
MATAAPGTAQAADAQAAGGATAPFTNAAGTGGASYGNPAEPAVDRAAQRRAARRRAARRHAAKARARGRARARARRQARRREQAERPAPAPPPTPERPASDHVFPVQGPFSLGGPDSRFGAKRRGHVHEGQDVAAPLGTPVVAPWAGTVEWVRFQRSGAGHYVVLDGAGENRDYVLMHLRPGSILVEQGDVVAAGQQLAQVGSSGGSSGPHLHFEIWVKGGWYTGGRPVDPYRFLRAWLR